MCTVKVFLVSDATRGSESTAPAGARRVRRKLFETEGAAPASNFLDRIWEEIGKESERKWNFDFGREAPLPGRYEWVPVGGRRPESMPVVREEAEGKGATAPKQRKITDFMSHKKRVRASEATSVSKVRRLNSGIGQPTSSAATT